MTVIYNGLEVEISEYDFEFEADAYVTSASYVDSGTELTAAEMDEVSRLCQDEIYQDGYEHAACRAYDDYKDRDL